MSRVLRFKLWARLLVLTEGAEVLQTEEAETPGNTQVATDAANHFRLLRSISDTDPLRGLQQKNVPRPKPRLSWKTMLSQL